MNFLAHLYLSEPTPAALIGNLLPDLVRGRSDPGWPAEVAAGVRNHRRVDAFTDTHPLFARSKGRIFPFSGRFSGILVDVFYDHYLSRAWDAYHPLPLERFVASSLGAMRSRPDLMPPPMGEVIDRMADEGWLLSYRTPEGLRQTLGRMSRHFTHRFGRVVDLTPVMDALPGLDAGLERDFRAFFPELVAYTRASRP